MENLNERHELRTEDLTAENIESKVSAQSDAEVTWGHFRTEDVKRCEII